MKERPDLPLRTVAEETGLSLGTAHDVRQRLLRGETPVPEGRRGAARPAPRRDTRTPRTAPGAGAGGQQARPAAETVPFPRGRSSTETLRRLANDPSLRHSEAGRQFLRWLHTHILLDDTWRKVSTAVPAHCASTVAELAMQCANTWKRFAEDLARRRLSDVPATPGIRVTSKPQN